MWTLCNNFVALCQSLNNFEGGNLMRLEKFMHEAVMTTDNARAVAMTCDRCQSKMQTIADLLLISCDARPITSEDLFPFAKSHSRCRDQVLDTLEKSSHTVKEIAAQINSSAVKWKDMCIRINDMSENTIRLAESCGHVAYLTSINFPDCLPARAGIVDKYKVSRANIEIKMCCTRLKRSRMEDLSSQFLVDICSNISKALSVMTDICRHAGEHAIDSCDQEQFKLCIKSITSSTSCLIASIKCFKSQPNSLHLNRVIAFCDPVISASSALVTFTTEDGFIGKPAHLSQDAKEMQKSILGACMSVTSVSIQICRSVRDLAYDITNPHHHERIVMCTESMDRMSAILTDLLMTLNIEDSASNSPSSSVSSTSSR